ncbi:MAG: hypothetical protein J0I09_11125 [Sphingobacteriia bacterium]|nr:hypothetical protein [Sphingobacteriia bacterium]
MKFLIATVLTVLLSYAFGLFDAVPWYSFAFCSLIVALTIHQKPVKAFLSGFLALFFLWGILAAMIDTANNHLLSHRIALVLPLKGSSVALVLLTAFIGGLVSGLAALTGSFLRKK